MGGLTFEKLLLIGVIAVFIFGPDRLPHLAQQLAQLIKKLRNWTDDAKARVNEEIGEDFTDEDWRKLDPRQYDPRRIIREAWDDAGSSQSAPASPVPAAVTAGAAMAAGSVGGSAPAWAKAPSEVTKFTPGQAPFDSEAT